LKSLQELGEGTRLEDVQLPISDPTPAAEGEVAVLPRSNPKHAAVETATVKQTASCASLFISFSLLIPADTGRRPPAGSISYRPHGADGIFAGRQEL